MSPRLWRKKGLSTQGIDLLEIEQVYVELTVDPKQGGGGLTASDTRGGHWLWARHLELSQLPQMRRQDFAILGAPGTGKATVGGVISSVLLHIHVRIRWETSTLQMALIGYQAERHRIEEKIAEIRAQLRSRRSRQASSSFSRAGMPRANLDPDIAALQISRQAKYQKQWKRDGRCTQCGKQRQPDSAVFCPGCRAKIRVKVRERERRVTNVQRRNLGSISSREPSHERLIDLRKECSVEHRKTPEEPRVPPQRSKLADLVILYLSA